MREKRAEAEVEVARQSQAEASSRADRASTNEQERQEQLEAYHRPRRSSIGALKDRPGKEHSSHRSSQMTRRKQLAPRRTPSSCGSAVAALQVAAKWRSKRGNSTMAPTPNALPPPGATAVRV